MENDVVSVRVPGKVLLAGEFAVLDGKPALVAAVDKFVVCTSRPSDAFEIHGAGKVWIDGRGDEPGLNFAQCALQLARKYASGLGKPLTPRAFHLTDELRDERGQKLGLGSSACVCVAVVAACLTAIGVNVSDSSDGCRRGKDTLFKLAALAHVQAQQKVGSCVDVAAATFGGLIETRRFEFETHEPLLKFDDATFAHAIATFPLHPVEEVPAPSTLLLLFGGKSASTPVHVRAVREAAKRHPSHWATFLESSERAVLATTKALKNHQLSEALEAMDAAFVALDDFAIRSDLAVELTPSIHRDFRRWAKEVGASAKPSGAGGGDVAFALGETEVLQALKRRFDDLGKTSFLVHPAQGATVIFHGATAD